MTTLAILLYALYLAVSRYTIVAQDAISMSGYRLPNHFQYLALAPKVVRPAQTYNIFVTIYSVPYSHVTLRATLSRNGEEYASGTTIFTQKGTKNVQLLIPITALPGDHKLTIEGLINDGFGARSNETTVDPVVSASNYRSDGQPVFKNETAVQFHTKYTSLFVTTDRPVYFPPNTVYFRVLGVTPALDPVNGEMTIKVKDSNGVVVRRWLQKQLNFGTYADSFDIPYPVAVGNWSISVDAFGHVYEHNFLVKFFFQKRFDVIVKCPLFMFDTEWGFSCTVEGEHTSSRAIDGNATLSVRVRDLNGMYMSEELTKVLPYVTGVSPFDFTMNSIEEKFGDISGMEVDISVYLTEFWSMETIKGNAIIKVKKDGVIIKALGKRYRAFKPNSPFEVVFVVQRSDGTPYEGFLNRQIVIQVFYEGENSREVPEDKMVVPDDSVVRYTVTPEDGDQKIIVRAWHVITMQTVEVECYRYWSENKKYISITTSTVEPRVNEYMVFTIRTNFFVDEVNYLVMGQGNILLGSSLTMKKLQQTFALALSRAMAPAARVLVYCIVDGEILTDALNFHIQDKRLHKADLIINKGKDFKGDHVELIGKGVPGAFISFQGHDWEFYRRGAGTFINERRVIRELLTYNEGLSAGADGGDFGNDVDLPFQQIWYYPDDRWEGSVFFTAPTSGINHETTFNVSGLVALSDMNLTVTPESTPCNRTLGFGRCLNGACFELKYLCDGKIDCTADGYDEMACPIRDVTPPRPSELDNLHLVQQYFRAKTEWLWHTTYVKHTGQTELTVEVPDTDAAFAISAYVVHPEEGLAIVDQPQEYDTTRQFFMTTEGPSEARRGEQLGVRCTVFNQWHQEIQVIMTLHGSDSYRFVVVEEFGIVRSYDPRTLTGDIQIMVWLPAMTSRYIHFPVLPVIEAGEVEITISAFSILRTAVGKLNVEISYDGVENDDQEPYLVDLVNQGSVLIPNFDIPIPEHPIVPERREMLYVPNSNVAHLYVYGDVVSPGFFEDHLDCENTAEFPHDSADGYMYEFAINLQTLKYLQTTNALTRDAERKALTYMKSIVARQYAYIMMPEGAFRMFRRTNSPSIWLTSFVLHWFHAAQMSEWNEDLFIDMTTLNQVASWLADQFNHTSKRYEETSTYVYDRDMLPTTIDHDGNEHEWHIPLTAQVVITLAQATRITGAAKGKADIVVEEACVYLSSKLLDITNPFQMAIVAYALNVANHGTKEDAYALLKGMRRETEFVYWSQEEVPPNDVRIVNTRQLMQPKEDWYNTGHAVQATSYALLLYLSHNEFEASRPIMKWLQTQHNGFMAWSSSRDGLMALQALTAYAYRETNRDIYQMTLTIQATRPDWEHIIRLNKTNFAQLHHFVLDRAWGEFKAQAQGTGYAYIHMTALTKVEKPWLVQTPEFKNFELRLDEAYFYGRNASYANMTWCIKWVRPDMAVRSGMMFLAIDVPTGYVIARDMIDYIHTLNVTGLKRMRYRNNMVYVFFESVGQREVCFEYRMDRWYPVANISIPHQAKVFEYTETGNQLNTMYETYTLFHLHICQVCGSYQCPYCPFYNSAPSSYCVQLAVMLIVTLLGVLIT